MIRGNAVVAMWCDIAPEVREEFDDWHTHEHMPERLSIPGFNRGSRWRDAAGGEGRFHMYEADSLATVSSGPYLERLDDPTPWSRKMMPHHRKMVRSLCQVVASHGAGLGHCLLSLRLSPQPAREQSLGDRLAGELPQLPRRKGICAAHFLKDVAAGPAAPTAEQSIRGNDSRADWIVLVNGYEQSAVAALAEDELGGEMLSFYGAQAGTVARVYALSYELAAP